MIGAVLLATYGLPHKPAGTTVSRMIPENLKSRIQVRTSLRSQELPAKRWNKFEALACRLESTGFTMKTLQQRDQLR
jgi:hypothetical protein